MRRFLVTGGLVDTIPGAANIDARAETGPIRYSVCTLVTDETCYLNMLASFRAAGFDGPETEFLYVDNRSGTRYDGYAAVNEFLHRARGEYVILCHQDILLHADRRDTLDHRLAELSRLDPAWAVCGNAGGVAPGQLALRITDGRDVDARRGRLPARVYSLDENFMIVRRAANLSTSTDLHGFHLYGTDLCIVARILGRNCYVIDFHLRHLGGRSQPGQPGHREFMRDVRPARQRLVRKYRRAFAPRWVQTSTQTLFISGSRLLNAIGNRQLIMSIASRWGRLRSR
jgi:hypothetical protein